MKSGWEVKTLGDIIKLEYGKPLSEDKRNYNGKYPIYGANGIIGKTNEFYHDKQTIIVGRKGSAGEVNLTEEKFWPLDVTYYVTFDREQFDLSFLNYLLINSELTKLAKGVKPGINRNDVYALRTKIPPLPEQKRIVAILDKAFAAIDKAKENAEKNLQNAKELFESYLQQNVENKAYQGIRFGNVCELIGGSQPAKKFFEFKPKNGFIRLIQVRDYKTEKYATYIPTSMAKRLCKKDDIMIGRYGPPIFGIFRGLEGAYNVALMKAEVNEEYFEKDYFFWFLQNNKLRQSVERTSKRAVGQDGVRIDLLADYLVPQPSKKEQRTIIHKLNLINHKTQTMVIQYQNKLLALEELRKSILQIAFNGELTTK